ARRQASPPGPDARLGRRQHLRRRSAVAGPSAWRAAHAPAHQRPDPHGGRRRRPGHDGGARCGPPERPRAARGRQRRLGLLLALARRVRAGGPPVPALRHARCPRVLHEPVLVLMPRVPAAPSPEEHAVTAWGPETLAELERLGGSIHQDDEPPLDDEDDARERARTARYLELLDAVREDEGTRADEVLARAVVRSL